MISGADTAWVLISSALVLMMIPGIAFFYGGLVRRKNIAGTLMQVVVTMGVVGVVWVLWGYSLAFGPSIGGLVGSIEWLGLAGVSATDAGPYSGRHSAPDVYDLPGHVRDDHTRDSHRRIR